MSQADGGLTEQQLASLLEKLNEVLHEAERLRTEVSQQLRDQRASQQQRVSSTSRPARPRTAKPGRKR